MEEEEEFDLDTGKSRTLYKENPSIEHVRPYLKVIGKQRIREYYNGRYITYTINKYKDTRTYAKFYFTNDTMENIAKLTQVSLILIFHILNEMKYGSSEIYLTSGPFCAMSGFTRTSFYRGMQQLLDERWLFALETPKMYAINLFRMSKGSTDDVIRGNERAEKIRLLKDHNGPKLRTREDNIRKDDNEAIPTV